jgi:hypothetical protein
MWLGPLSPASLGSLLQGLWHALRLDTHLDVVSGAAAASSFIAQLFLVQAMLVYEPTGPWGHGKPAAEEEKDVHCGTSADSTPRSDAYQQQGGQHLGAAAGSETELDWEQTSRPHTAAAQAASSQHTASSSTSTTAAAPAADHQSHQMDDTQQAGHQEDVDSPIPTRREGALVRSLDGGRELVSKGIHALVEGGAVGAQTARRVGIIVDHFY